MNDNNNNKPLNTSITNTSNLIILLRILCSGCRSNCYSIKSAVIPSRLRQLVIGKCNYYNWLSYFFTNKIENVLDSIEFNQKLNPFMFI